MFDVSDQELDGMESRAEGPQPRGAYQPIGDEGPIGPNGIPQPAPPSPTPPPTPFVPYVPSGAAAGAGKALILVTIGMVGGAILGGPWGAGAGIALAGAARNLARVKDTWGSANAEDRDEAGKSATMALFGIGLAGALGYQAYKAREA